MPTTKEATTDEGPGDGLPSAAYPSVFSPGPGREATDEEFRKLFGDLEP